MINAGGAPTPNVRKKDSMDSPVTVPAPATPRSQRAWLLGGVAGAVAALAVAGLLLL